MVMRRALVVVLLAAAVAAPLADTAVARSRKVKTFLPPSSITWDKDGNTVVQVEGTITSEKAKCLPGRAVTVTTGPSATLQSPYGSGTTDANGHFAVSGSAPDDAYYSIFVDKVRVGNARCKSTAAYGQFS